MGCSPVANVDKLELDMIGTICLRSIVHVSRVCSIFIISAYLAYIIFQLFTHREALADSVSASMQIKLKHWPSEIPAIPLRDEPDMHQR